MSSPDRLKSVRSLDTTHSPPFPSHQANPPQELRSLKATLRSERSEREAIDRVRLSLQTREDAIDSAEKVAKPRYNTAVQRSTVLFVLTAGWVLQELERTCKLMGEVEEEHTKYKQVLKSVRDGEQKIELHSAEMTELQTKLEVRGQHAGQLPA